MCWGYRDHHYHRYQYMYGCDDVEEWVYNPRCCEMYGDDDCREYYDNIDIKEWVMWEWIMGALFIGAIALTLILCCCWRRGCLCFSRCPFNQWRGCCCCKKQTAPEPIATYQNTYSNPQMMGLYSYNQQFVGTTNPDTVPTQTLPGFAPTPYQPSPINPNWVQPQQTNFNQFK